MIWRRKPDGRPYADVTINGQRRRISLLTQADAGTPLTDAECQHRYDLFAKTILPTLQSPIPNLQSPIPNPQSPIPNLQSLFTWYTDTYMPARNYAPSSRIRNQRTYAQFLHFAHARNILTLAQLNREPAIIDAYTAQALKVHQPGTVHHDLDAIRAAFNAARKRGLPIPNIDWPHIRKPDPAPIELPTPAQLKQLLDHLAAGVLDYPARGRRNPPRDNRGRLIPNPQSPIPNPQSRIPNPQSPIPNPSPAPLRPRVTALSPSALSLIIQFIAYTGVRPSDACNLTIDRLRDLDTDEPIALITQQKTGRLIPIALSPPALAAIQSAIPNPQSPIPNRLVFLDRRGHPIQPNTISRCLTYHSLRLGLPRITAKTLRQMIVSTLYDIGADPQLIARVTGHRSRAIEAYRKIRHGAPHTLVNDYAQLLATGEESSP